MSLTSAECQRKFDQLCAKWQKEWKNNAEIIYRALYPPHDRFAYPLEAVSVRHYREHEAYRAGGQALADWRQLLADSAEGRRPHATMPQRLTCAALLFDLAAFDRLWAEWMSNETRIGESETARMARLAQTLIEGSYCEDRGRAEGGNVLTALAWQRPSPCTECVLTTEPPAHSEQCAMLGALLSRVSFASPLLGAATTLGGWTPLMVSVRRGTLCHTLRLLRHGARVDAANDAGENVCYVAAERADTTRLRWLLTFGADLASHVPRAAATAGPFAGTIVDSVLQMKSPENAAYMTGVLTMMETRVDKWFKAEAEKCKLKVVKALTRAHSYRPLDHYSVQNGKTSFDPWALRFAADLAGRSIDTETFACLVFFAVRMHNERSRRRPDEPAKLVMRRAEEEAKSVRMLHIELNDVPMALASDFSAVDMWTCTAETMRQTSESVPANDMRVRFTAPDTARPATEMFLAFRAYLVSALPMQEINDNA